MYAFIDTTESPGDYSLPAEAVQINGEYIENKIEGYRTLAVSGREMLGAEIEEREINSIDGTKYLYRSYPARDIEVTFQMLASSAQELTDKFNRLNKILYAEQAQLIFADEPDKFFVGTPSGVEKPEAGRNNVVASFTLHCSDPYKYATVKKEFEATLQDGALTATIQNEGNAQCPIDYEISMSSENGYIGILSERGEMQYGYIDEADTAESARSEVLFSVQGATDFADKMLADPRVRKNVTYGTDKPTWNGEIGSYNYKNEYGTQTWNCLHLKNQGTSSGVPNGSWHGGNLYIDVPKKSDNTLPTDFEIETRSWFSAARPAQRGGVYLDCIDEDGASLCTLWWWDGSASAYHATCRFDVQGHGKVYQFGNFGSGVNGGAGIKPRVNGGGCVQIKKAGSKISFNFMDTVKEFNFSELTEKRLKAVVIGFVQVSPTTDLVTRMDILNYFKITANNVSYTYDIPNRYQAGDVIYVDGENGKVYKNGVLTLEDEILGSTYFGAPAGNTKIEFLKSGWANQIGAKAVIRERWL